MRIKLSYHFAEEPIFRQTPQGLGLWKGHQFFGNDRASPQCDFWVVLEDLAYEEEVAQVGSGRSVLISLEPPRPRKYPPGFLAQFDLIVSCHRDLPHSNVRHDCLGFPWHLGLNKGANAAQLSSRPTLDFDALSEMKMPDKPRALSVICSRASGLPGHAARRKFVEELQAELGDRVDVFGRDVRPIADKADAIVPYRYHIVLENSRLPDYWTEKLADSYLGWSFPIYWGCPNVTDYFGRDSLIEIDISRPQEAIALIKALGDEKPTAKQVAALATARALVLDSYNTFDVVRRACESLPPAAPREIVIRSQRAFRPRKLQRLLTSAARRLSFTSR
jgi:hypothetical protein